MKSLALFLIITVLAQALFSEDITSEKNISKDISNSFYIENFSAEGETISDILLRINILFNDEIGKERGFKLTIRPEMCNNASINKLSFSLSKLTMNDLLEILAILVDGEVIYYRNGIILKCSQPGDIVE